MARPVLRPLRRHRQPERVAAGVGPADHLVALVVVAEDEDPLLERRLGGSDASLELALRLGLVAVAASRSACHRLPSVRVAVVGPFHPYKGGIAQHTTTLAHRLSERGHALELIGWRRQYPKLLYPGQLTVDEPE